MSAPARRPADPPHRRLFALATALWLAAALWWAAQLAAAAAGRPLPPPVLPAGSAHALSMTLGALPLYFAGFLATALPRWAGVPAPDGHALRAPTAVAAAGWLLWWPALYTAPAAAAGALGLAAVGLAGLVALLTRALRHGDPAAGPHARRALAGTAVCALGLGLAAVAVAAPAPRALAAGPALALWVGVAPVVLTAARRLSPWLGDGGAPGRAALGAAALVAAGALPAADTLGWPVPLALRAAVALLLAVAAAALAWSLRRGALPRGQRTPMLRMLRAAAGWLALALLLAALREAAAAAATAAGGPAVRTQALGALAAACSQAATHALALGGVGGHWLAMVSRVTAVQAGQAQAPMATVWRLHGLLQALAAWRVLAALAAAGPAAGLLAGARPPAAACGPALAAALAVALAAAAAAWAALLAAWAACHGRWLRRGADRVPAPGASSPSSLPRAGGPPRR